MNLPFAPLVVLFAICVAPAMQATEAANPQASDMPAVVPMERYQSLLDKSPFAPATVPVAPVAPEAVPSFAQDLYVTGVATINGADFVTITSRDLSRHIALVPGDVLDGMSLASVEWSQEVGKSKVHLKKGSELAVLEFDPAAMQGGIAPNGEAPPPQPQVIGQPPQPGIQSVPFIRSRRPQGMPNGGAFHPPMPGKMPPNVRSRVIPNRPVR